MGKSIYYDLSRLLSYKKLVSIVIGNRGGGKSYAAKAWAIRGWIRNKKQFIYLRRFATEFEFITNWFSDIQHEFPEHEFMVKGGCFYIDDEIAGYYIPLSTSQKNKSTSYPDVDKIIFDEFIIDKGAYHYLKDEVTMLLDFCETVFRLRDDGRILLISNAITVANPYFLYFKLFPKHDTTFITRPQVVLEMYKSKDFIEAKKKTRFGQLIDGTKYGAYNMENEFYKDSNTFIEKKTGKCIPWLTVIFIGRKYSVWYGTETGWIYFTRGAAPDNRPTYALTTADHDVNMLLIKNIKSNHWFKSIKESYEMSYVRFDCIESKAAFYDIMQLL